MNEKILKWLFDIQAAIDEIESFFKDYPLDFNLYKSRKYLSNSCKTYSTVKTGNKFAD
jgi:hypothetical protein